MLGWETKHTLKFSETTSEKAVNKNSKRYITEGRYRICLELDDMMGPCIAQMENKK